MIQGFKKFIMRGNVIELAVAVVIADAFTPIVKNLVDSVINPSSGAWLANQTSIRLASSI